jgi:hypothetical protein
MQENEITVSKSKYFTKYGMEGNLKRLCWPILISFLDLKKIAPVQLQKSMLVLPKIYGKQDLEAYSFHQGIF